MPDRSGFLEPIYLNTSMVMNAAGYLFGGVATTDERTETTGKEKGGGVKVGVPFLESVVGLAANAKASQSLTVREVRELTVGGLHMNVVDALRKKDILRTMTRADFEGFELNPGTYVETRVVLKPVEYHAILRLCQVLAPIAGQAASGFPKVRELFRRPTTETADESVIALPASLAEAGGMTVVTKDEQDVDWWAHYPEAVRALAESLEADFLRAKELEVVLEDPSTGEVFGIASLDLEGYDIDQLRARISYVEGTVIGKITRFASYEETLPLLQHTAIIQVVELARKVVEMTGQVGDFDAKFDLAGKLVQGVIPIRVEGPAVKLTAMSVCI